MVGIKREQTDTLKLMRVLGLRIEKENSVRRRFKMKRIFLILLLLLLLFCGIVIFNQENIVHPKRRALQPYHLEWLEYPKEHSMKIVKDKYVLIVTEDSTLPLSKRSQKIEDELLSDGFSKESLKDNGIIVMFHGKNGRKEDLLPVAERYVRAGFVSVLADLPAHGSNPKERTDYGQGEEQQFYEEVLAIAEHHIEMKGKPIYLWGMSLGGAYAISSASSIKREFPAPKALILVSTFDKLSYVLEGKSVDIFGDYLGAMLYRALLVSLDTFYGFNPEKSDSAMKAKGIDIPLFMLHGKKDKLIGYEHGEKLFKSFSSKVKELHLDENGDHHNILITEYPFYKKSIEFLLKQNFKKN
jgi:alpha-beta hydrolase superfamily lysophospholipase